MPRAILGGFPEGQPASPSRASAIRRHVLVSWGDLVTDAPGTYQIARLDVPVQGVSRRSQNTRIRRPTRARPRRSTRTRRHHPGHPRAHHAGSRGCRRPAGGPPPPGYNPPHNGIRNEFSGRSTTERPFSFSLVDPRSPPSCPAIKPGLAPGTASSAALRTKTSTRGIPFVPPRSAREFCRGRKIFVAMALGGR